MIGCSINANDTGYQNKDYVNLQNFDIHNYKVFSSDGKNIWYIKLWLQAEFKIWNIKDLQHLVAKIKVLSGLCVRLLEWKLIYYCGWEALVRD